MWARPQPLIVLLLCGSLTALSQEPSERSKHFDDSDSRLINCEQYSADIDRMRGAFSDLIEQSDFIILVARLGNGEKSRELNRRRLHNVSERIKAAGVKPKKIVVAEGGRVLGLGRVEIYVGGKIVESLRVKRNKDICVECCGPDERFYPYREKFERKGAQNRRGRAKQRHAPDPRHELFINLKRAGGRVMPGVSWLGVRGR